MDITEMQFRLKECFDAQKRNEKTYLKEILKLHIELNDYIIMNGVDSFAEKKYRHSTDNKYI